MRYPKELIFLITYAKIDRWGDALEPKEYSRALAGHNPGHGGQFALWEDCDPNAGIVEQLLAELRLHPKDVEALAGLSAGLLSGRGGRVALMPLPKLKPGTGR